MASLKILARLRRCESGAEFVEMALAFPLLMLVVLGIIDFGMLFQQYEVITNAAREGARVAILPAYSPLDAENRVKQYLDAGFLGDFGANGGTIVVGTPQTAFLPGGTCITTIAVTVNFPHAFPFVGGVASYFGGSWGTATLTAQSTMRAETAGSCP